MIDVHAQYDIFKVKLGNCIFYDFAELGKGQYQYDLYMSKLCHYNPLVNDLLADYKPEVKIIMRVNGELNPPLLVKSLVSFAGPNCINEGAGSLIDRPYDQLDAFATQHTNLLQALEARKRWQKSRQKVDDDDEDYGDEAPIEHKPVIKPASKFKTLHADWQRPPENAKRWGLTWEGKDYRSVAACIRLNYRQKLSTSAVYDKLNKEPDERHHWNYIIPRAKS